MSKPRIVIIGASSAIAEHCARLWVRAAVELVLVGRDLVRVSRVAADLRVRSPHSTVTVLEASFNDPGAIARLADALTADRPVDVVLIAHGSLPVQNDCESDLSMACDALEVNGVSPVLLPRPLPA